MGPSSTFFLSGEGRRSGKNRARLIIGFTEADLTNLINDAKRPASPRPADDVCFDDFTVAIERIVAGIEKKSRALSKDERRRAYHEMGHALVAASLPGVDPVQIVSSLRGAITLDQ